MATIFTERLIQAYNKTSRSTQKKTVLLNLFDIIEILSNELENCKYKPSRFSCFVVQYPKIREIFAPNFSDRLVQHILIDELVQLIDKRFIYDSYANRKEKGTHKAIKRLQNWMQKPINRYFIQLDIDSFFPSIDKDILIDILIKHLKSLDINRDKKIWYWRLAKKIIMQNVIEPMPYLSGDKTLLKQIPKHKSLFNISNNKGLPIGSLSSQFFSNLYLNELDQFVKHKLKIRNYVRYVDDFVILGNTAQELNKYKDEIDKFLFDKLRLKLHPKKVVLNKIDKGINFLGYIIFKDYTLVRNRVVKSFKNRLCFFKFLFEPEKYSCGKINGESKLIKQFKSGNLKSPLKPDILILNDMLSVINSYYGIFCFANSFKLKRDLYRNHFGLLKLFFIPKDYYHRVFVIKEFLYNQ